MNPHKIKLFILTITVMFGVFAYRITSLDNIITDNRTSQEHILELKLLNKQMNDYFKNGLNQDNYDDINKIARDFGVHIEGLKLSSGFTTLSEIYDSQKDINTIFKAYKLKLELLDKYNYISSGAVLFLMDGERDIKKDSGLKKLELLFSRIKNVDFKDIKSINQAEEEVQLIADDMLFLPNGVEHLSLLKKANYVLISLRDLRGIYQQNLNLDLSLQLENLSIVYNGQYRSAINSLYWYGIGTLFTILIFVVLTLMLLKQQKELRKNLEKYKLAVDNDYTSMIFTNEKNLVSYTNKAFEEIHGYKQEDVLGKNPNILKSFLHQDSFYQDIRDAIKETKSWSATELVSKSKSGKYIYERVNFIPFIFEGKPSGFIGIKMDKTAETNMVNELKKKNEQLKAQSSIDKLTGFGNYFAMVEMLESKKDGVVIAISIKNFDNLRFFYQTKVIEAMLTSFAKTLKLCVETSEISTKLFRFQDDEFFLWYSGNDAHRDIAYIQDYFSFGEMEIDIDGRSETLPGPKVVIGISLNRDTIQTNRLIQAILAKQQAFKLGNDIYQYKENDEIELQYYKNQSTTQLIEYALENNTVIVECQGIFDITTDTSNPKTNYYEVLVRLVDQNGKIRYPGEFLGVAMQTQLYTRITKKVIEHAFVLAERYPEHVFSINLSGIDIIDNSVREFLEEKLRECSNPSHICFEILESEDIGDYDMINSFIKHIKGYGSKISIDDFGSGYSNYYRILELDIDTIKIDGSIIKKLPFDKNSQYLVETIVNFASKQNYKIVAEFVSSDEILEQVKKFGIDYAQGFLLGKPTSVDNL
ncbi:bifunctional diguanylate cyclase/phosphodiesterase [Campylobacter mucosalis]|uniref:bifunctional diguanylate cyclase/phosphodiesterase n=1 Tax=Campylobacter mucosalis TaxID=202 RepID=UPI001470482D|nr:EAL domain-containing protein [Campylobacter mucosalis]